MRCPGAKWRSNNSLASISSNGADVRRGLGAQRSHQVTTLAALRMSADERYAEEFGLDRIWYEDTAGLGQLDGGDGSRHSRGEHHRCVRDVSRLAPHKPMTSVGGPQAFDCSRKVHTRDLEFSFRSTSNSLPIKLDRLVCNRGDYSRASRARGWRTSARHGG